MKHGKCMQDQYLDTFLSHSTGDGSTIKISPFIKALDSAKDKPELLSAVCILGDMSLGFTEGSIHKRAKLTRRALYRDYETSWKTQMK